MQPGQQVVKSTHKVSYPIVLRCNAPTALATHDKKRVRAIQPHLNGEERQVMKPNRSILIGLLSATLLSNAASGLDITINKNGFADLADGIFYGPGIPVFSQTFG